ncbi:MAG: hypothetical protein OEY36_09150 [Gammaproteobacteria bacterium]|nr:hypothetical protein [Gammaproteobacteria bacterium]
MYQKLVAVALLVFFSSSSQAGLLNKEGKWYGYYGWNRAEYSNSDLHLTGNGYDFTLYDVQATDRPTPTALDPYLNPAGLTLPQSNGRVGYYLTDTFSVSFGNDHMKYVMVQDQTVTIDGTISTGEGFDGTYAAGTPQQLTTDFLTFEHTDGLNFISFEFEHFLPLWLQQQAEVALSAYWGLGYAIMYPKTNATLFGRERNDQFHTAGYGLSIKAGAEVLFKYDIFMRVFVKTGQIEMNDVRTTSSSSDKLTQEFSFLQTAIVFGMNF